MQSRQLRVAAIQVQSDNGRIADNLARAGELVARAAEQGAQLVLCPEFLAAGYIYDESIWKSAETRGGPTEQFLARLASKHGIHVGATYLEAEGDDFWNTFALAAPDGTIAGRVRKESLPMFEGWYFKSCPEPKTIDTDLGRIAVGICQDNHTARFLKRVAHAQPDLILMPHSAPCAPFVVRMTRENLREAGAFYARALGVPVVLVNKAHTPTRSPIPGIPGLRLPFRFPGLSSIVDSDGSVVARLPNGEDALVGDVTLDPARKRRPDIAPGYWSLRPKRFSRIAGAVLIVMERLGKRAYAKNSARPVAARAIASQGEQKSTSANLRHAC